MLTKIATIDFYVTSQCNQACPYYWGPKRVLHPVGTATAIRIIDKIKRIGVRRIIFTGGDPLKRPDIGPLIWYAKGIGLKE